MSRIVKSIEIDAPNEHVFALATDLTKQPEWTTFVKEAIITSGDGKSTGTTDRYRVKVGPRVTSADGIWTAYEPGAAFGRSNTSGMPLNEKLSFTAVGSRTRVDWAVDYAPPMGPIGRFVDLAFMNRVYQNELEASLENLKAALEV